MHKLLVVAQVLSIVAFLVYGLGCFYSKTLVVEFERYNLSALRRVTGALQVAGALGLLVGFLYDPLKVLAAACLAVMMIVALFVRAKIGDPILLWAPAFSLFALNLFVASSFWMK
jgi:hypothetical protein